MEYVIDLLEKEKIQFEMILKDWGTSHEKESRKIREKRLKHINKALHLLGLRGSKVGHKDKDEYQIVYFIGVAERLEKDKIKKHLPIVKKSVNEVFNREVYDEDEINKY